MLTPTMTGRRDAEPRPRESLQVAHKRLLRRNDGGNAVGREFGHYSGVSSMSASAVSSPLMRHIGTPIPGVVNDPVKYRPSDLRRAVAAVAAGRSGGVCVPARELCPPWRCTARRSRRRRTASRRRCVAQVDAGVVSDVGKHLLAVLLADLVAVVQPRRDGDETNRFEWPSGATVSSVFEGTQR